MNLRKLTTDGKSVYVFMCGELNECKLKRTRYICDIDKKEFTFTLNVVELNGKEIELFNEAIYYNPKDFLDNNPIRTYAHHIPFKESGYYWDEDINNVVYYNAYEAIESLYFDYEDNEVHIENGYYPEDLFESEEDVRKYYPIVVKKMDGTTSEIGGALSTLMLNDEQEKLLIQFKQLLCKMKEANLSIIEDDCDMYAFNNSNVVLVDVYSNYEHKATFLERYRVKEMEYNYGVFRGYWSEGIGVNIQK